MFWDKFNNFLDRTEMKRLFEGKDLIVAKAGTGVKVKDKEVKIKVYLPGVEKKNIMLNVTDSYVEVRAERKKESKIKKKGLFKEERSYRGYYQVIPLSVGVKAEDAKAEYKNGVLEIKIPRAKSERKEVKKIKVK